MCFERLPDVIKEARVVGVGDGVADPALVDALVRPLSGLLLQVVATLLDLVWNKYEAKPCYLEVKTRTLWWLGGSGNS